VARWLAQQPRASPWRWRLQNPERLYIQGDTACESLASRSRKTLALAQARGQLSHIDVGLNIQELHMLCVKA
jgi:hypothetical protein